MKARYWLAALALCAGCRKIPDGPPGTAPPVAQQPAPPALPKLAEAAPPPHEPRRSGEIDKATVAAWDKRGFTFTPAGELNHNLPTFAARWEGFRLEWLKDLPPVAVPFGVRLEAIPVTDAELSLVTALPNLTALDLARTKITDVGLKHLAAMPDLIRLRLSNTRITDAGLKHLLALKKLTTLGLWDVYRVKKDALAELAAAPALTTLSISGNQVTDRVLAAFREAGRLHVLGPATAADGGRPQTDADIATLELHYSPVTPAGLKELAALPNLTALGLAHAEKVGDAGLEELAACKKLVKLNVQGIGATGTGLKPLAALSLTDLNLSDNPLSAEGVRALAGLTHLTDLDLEDIRITDRNLKELRPLTNLTALYLRHTAVTAVGLKELAAFERLDTLIVPETNDATLTALASVDRLHAVIEAKAANGQRPTRADEVVAFELKYTDQFPEGPGGLTRERPWVSDAGLKALAGFRNLTTLTVMDEMIDDRLEEIARHEKLTSLTIFSGRITDSGLEYLAPLRNLTSLNLYSDRVTDAGLKHLAPLKNLTALGLFRAPVTDAGLRALAKSHPHLTGLDLAYTNVTDAGLKELAAFKNLTSLRLGGRKTVTEGGLAHLAALENLTELSLDGPRLTAAGVKALGTLTKLKQLSLSLSGTQVGGADIGELQKRLPTCEIGPRP
jgi:Leucine-rich repeat (LRR) protein